MVSRGRQPSELHRLGLGYSVHDLKRTAATWSAEMLCRMSINTMTLPPSKIGADYQNSTDNNSDVINVLRWFSARVTCHFSCQTVKDSGCCFANLSIIAIIHDSSYRIRNGRYCSPKQEDQSRYSWCDRLVTDSHIGPLINTLTNRTVTQAPSARGTLRIITKAFSSPPC